MEVEPVARILNGRMGLPLSFGALMKQWHGSSSSRAPMASVPLCEFVDNGFMAGDFVAQI